MKCRKLPKACGTAGRGTGFKTLHREAIGQQIGDRLLIFDNENFCFFMKSPFFSIRLFDESILAYTVC